MHVERIAKRIARFVGRSVEIENNFKITSFSRVFVEVYSLPIKIKNLFIVGSPVACETYFFP